LVIALREFKRDKINKQNARLSLANAADENPSMPRRKILLSTGANNYRPPLERSKSAPKLFSIEEMIDEEDEEEEAGDDSMKFIDKKKREEMKSCCKEDHLYPSVTLGRRRCRRGHSIRKSRLLRGALFSQQKSFPPTYRPSFPAISSDNIGNDGEHKMESDVSVSNESDLSVVELSPLPSSSIITSTATSSSEDNLAAIRNLGSDEDFESFLLCNNYDSKDPLSNDLMSYFDMKLQTPTAIANIANNGTTLHLTGATTTASMSDLLDDENSLRNSRPCMSMSDLIDYQSDNELEDNESDIYFNQDSLLDTLRRQSTTIPIDSTNEAKTNDQSFIHDHDNDIVNKPADDFETNESDYSMVPTQSHNPYTLYGRVRSLEYSRDDDLNSESPSSLCMSEKTICVNLDSDEGSSISSGCETSSTVTTNAEENQLPRRGSVLDRVRTFEQMAESQMPNKNDHHAPVERKGSNNSGKFYLRSISNNSSFGNKSGNFIMASPESSSLRTARASTLTRTDNASNGISMRKVRIDDDSDELSDESGYVEFLDHSLKSAYA
jgi:hypothetical protein